MLENTWYSVISPENCSTILWRSWDFKEQAADALKLTATDMLKNKLVDGIIKEPVGGAHAFPEKMYRILKKELLSQLEELEKLDAKKLVNKRMNKRLLASTISLTFCMDACTNHVSGIIYLKNESILTVHTATPGIYFKMIKEKTSLGAFLLYEI